MTKVSITVFLAGLTWWIFVIYWFISAFRVKRTVEREGRGSRLIVLSLTGGGCALLFTSISNPALRLRALPESAAIGLVGDVLAIAGLAVLIWARRTIGSNWSGNITLKEGHELVQTGPYRFVRHPIYSGFYLMFFGSAIAIGTVAGFVGFAMTILGFWFKLRQEEALMVRHFGQKYLDYKSRVRSIIPWIL